MNNVWKKKIWIFFKVEVW